jgi:hypothetical protein
MQVTPPSGDGESGAVEEFPFRIFQVVLLISVPPGGVAGTTPGGCFCVYQQLPDFPCGAGKPPKKVGVPENPPPEKPSA